MAKKPKKIPPQILKQMEEVENFERELEEHRPVIVDPENPTEKERAAQMDWLRYRHRAWEAFVDRRLSPEELEAKYKRSPETQKELDEIETQIRQSTEQMKRLEGKQDTQEFFSVETKTWQLLDQLYEIMEKRGSPADKHNARAYKQARQTVTKNLAH